MFDTIDLMQGNVMESVFDFAPEKKLHILRTYNSIQKGKHTTLGNFRHNFDKRLNVKIPYEKEHIASKLKRTPKQACEIGWHEIVDDIHMGKLKDLDATFNKETNLCNVYDDYGNLKTTLVVKNKKTKRPIGKNLKLLQKADGTEVLFYKHKDGSWANVQNAPMNFSETDNGYEIVLDNGDKETYDFSGKLIEVKKDDLVITLYYQNNKLISLSDNREHKIMFRYKKSLLRKIINYDGTKIKYRYNDDKQLEKVIYDDGRTVEYRYNEHGELTEVYKDGILTKRYQYEDGKVVQSAGIKESNSKYFSYDSDSVEVDENGELIRYTFVVNHSQAKLDTVESDEGIAVYAYDDKGHQISFTDKLGVTRVTFYDKNGLLKEDIDNAGTAQEKVTKTEYDLDLRKPTRIEAPKKVTYKVYDDHGQETYNVDTLVDENGYALQNKIEHKVYDEKGLVVRHETEVNKSSIKYDTRGNAVEMKDQLGLVQKVTAYNKADLPLESVDSNGEVTQNSYDNMGRLTQKRVDGRVTATMKYDDKGRLIERTSKDGVVSYFKYDEAGNIIESGDSTGEKNIYIFDEYGNLTQTKRYVNGKLAYLNTKRYDNKHRVLSETDAYGNTTTYRYNQKGQKIQKIDPNGGVTTYEYNEIGKLAKEIDALGGETSYEYDEAGHRTKITTPNGAVFEYRYDGFGRLISELNPDKGLTEYTYDSEDRLLSVTNSNGFSKTNHYDDKGRLVDVSYDDSSLNVHYTYSAKSELIKISDASGSTTFVNDKEHLLKETKHINDHDFVLSYTYTPDDKVKTFTYPSGKTVGYNHNAQGEITSISIDGAPFITNVQMHNGKIVSYTYVDGTQHTRSYDQDERVLALYYPGYQEEISYDALSNIVTMQTDGDKKVFAFDAISRVVEFDANDTLQQHFTYDENGNRLSLENNLGDTTRYYYNVGSNILNQIEAENQAAVTFSYDDMGNIVDDGTHRYSYDGRNRLVSVDDNIFYQYNYANQRVSKTVDGVTTYYVYDGHKLLGEYDADGKMLREYLYLDDTPIAMMTAEQTYRIYADHLDTPRRVANENGAILWQWDFTPYGENKPTGSMTFNLRFPGQYYDAETGHHYNINRDYDPVTGRYTQSDPVGFKGGVNTYGYAEANPVMKRDEMGLWTSGAYGFPKVHQRANAIVFGYGWIKNILDSNTVAIDRHQKGYESYLHAMRGYAYSGARVVESYAAARTHSENFVINGMWMARSYLNRGDTRTAWANFGWVLHCLQDSTSPSHRYFQVWTGHESWAKIYQHARKEWSTPSNMNHPLYRASRWIHHMFHYRLIPSHGSIFMFFK